MWFASSRPATQMYVMKKLVNNLVFRRFRFYSGRCTPILSGIQLAKSLNGWIVELLGDPNQRPQESFFRTE